MRGCDLRLFCLLLWKGFPHGHILSRVENDDLTNFEAPPWASSVSIKYIAGLINLLTHLRRQDGSQWFGLYISCKGHEFHPGLLGGAETPHAM